MKKETLNRMYAFLIAVLSLSTFTITAKIHLPALSSEKVPRPVAVRYAYKNYTQASVYNIHGLPLAPFRTDNW